MQELSKSYQEILKWKRSQTLTQQNQSNLIYIAVEQLLSLNYSLWILVAVLWKTFIPTDTITKFFYNREKNWHIVRFFSRRAEVKVRKNKYYIFSTFLWNSHPRYSLSLLRHCFALWLFKPCLFGQHTLRDNVLIFNFWWLKR